MRKLLHIFKLYYPLKPGMSVLYDKIGKIWHHKRKRKHCVSESLHLVYLAKISGKDLFLPKQYNYRK